MKKELCGFRGNREKWKRFVETVRNNNTQVWGVLEPMIDEYIKEKE